MKQRRSWGEATGARSVFSPAPQLRGVEPFAGGSEGSGQAVSQRNIIVAQPFVSKLGATPYHTLLEPLRNPG